MNTNNKLAKKPVNKQQRKNRCNIRKMTKTTLKLRTQKKDYKPYNHQPQLYPKQLVADPELLQKHY